MSRLWRQRLILFALALAVGAREASAQNQFADAVLSLPSTAINGDTARLFDTPLFEGAVRATITNLSGSNNDFQPEDLISFRALGQGRNAPTGIGFTEDFQGTRAQFEEWAKQNAKALYDVFFPKGLATALSGRDTSTIYSQQLVLSTILDTSGIDDRRRRPSAGMFDTEWFTPSKSASTTLDQSGWAMQGMYAFSPTLSLQGRHSNLSRALSTSATSAALDYHPFIERGDDTRVRVGGMGRAGFLYSSTHPSASALSGASPIQMVTFDYSGGGWASVMRAVGPVLLGGGSLFQVTKHQALEGNNDDFRHAFAAAVNSRGLEYDVTVGGTARTDVTNRTSLIGSYAGTFALESAIDRPASHAITGAVMYTLGPGATLNAGYKTTSLAGGRANSIFFQGNFGW